MVLVADFGSNLGFDLLVGKPAPASAEPGCVQELTDVGQRSGLGGATLRGGAWSLALLVG